MTVSNLSGLSSRWRLVAVACVGVLVIALAAWSSPALAQQDSGDSSGEPGPVLNKIVGTDASETLAGTNQPDAIYAYGGHDLIYGYAGDDQIQGGAGDDRIYGGQSTAIGGGDVIRGGIGDDAIYGGPGLDQLFGGPGSDVVYGGAKNDVIDVSGDGPVDYVDCGPGHDQVTADRYDTIVNCEDVTYK